MTGMNSQNRIRYMTDEDVGDVCRIDAASFAKPWQQEEFIKAVHREDTIYLVADSGSAIVGFCGLWCSMEDADLCHIAVAPEQRSQGIATQLLGMAITECEHRGVKRILLEVRASNTAAIHCYHQMGFVQIGIRKKYYSQPKEDALLLEHQITNNGYGRTIDRDYHCTLHCGHSILTL